MEEESTARVIAQAAASGWHLSRPQLERRHRSGIIPRPRQIALGRGRGSVSVYPPGTGSALVKGLALEREHRSLDRVAWEMWLSGEPAATDAARAQLRQVAAFHDRISRFSRRLGFGRLELPRVARRLVARATSRIVVTEPFTRVDRRLGHPERTETFVRIMADLASGSYEPPAHIEGPSDDETQLFMNGLDVHADLDLPSPPGTASPRAAGNSLVDAARLLGGSWTEALDRASDADLDRSRMRWCRFRDGMRTVTEEIYEICGGSLYGLRAMARMLPSAPFETAAAILMALRADLDGQADFLRKVDAMSSAADEWRRGASPWMPALRALRGVPALADLLAPQSISRGLLKDDRSFGARVKAAAAAHQEEIDAALRAAGIVLPDPVNANGQPG